MPTGYINPNEFIENYACHLIYVVLYFIVSYITTIQMTDTTG